MATKVREGQLKQDWIDKSLLNISGSKDGSQYELGNAVGIVFDDASGFEVEEDPQNGSTWAKLSLGSHFKTIQVDGASDVVASGEDTLIFHTGSNMSFTTDPVTKAITFNASGGSSAAGNSKEIQFNTGGSFATAGTLIYDASQGRMGVGTSSPDGTLHVDGGASNTEIILEKDGATTASIVFDTSGTRRFDISQDASEILNFNSYAPNFDMVFNQTSDNNGTVRMLHIDGNDNGAVVVGNVTENDPPSGATLIVTGTMGSGLGTAFFVTQSNSVVPGLHLHNNRSTADTGIALRFSNHSTNAAASVGYYGQISLENTAGTPSLQNPDMVFKTQDTNTYSAANMVEAMRIKNGGNVGIGTTSPTSLLTVDGDAIFNESGADKDFRVESNNKTHMLFVDGGNDRVGIGTATPDNVLHIDNGSSNTALIIEKDSSTSGSVVFHNVGIEEADISYTAGSDFVMTNRIADITFIFVTGSAITTAITLDASEGSATVNNRFGREPTSGQDLGSATTSTLDVAAQAQSVVMVTAASITTPTSGPMTGVHLCTISNGKFNGQISTIVVDSDVLSSPDFETPSASNGSLMFTFGAGASYIGSSQMIQVTGSGNGGYPRGAAFTITWINSAWYCTSVNGAVSIM